MSRNAKAWHDRVRGRRLALNTDKVEAVLCIALSAVVSVGFFGWLFY